jgi:hypothetical protein
VRNELLSLEILEIIPNLSPNSPNSSLSLEKSQIISSPNLPKVHNELISWDTWEIISKLAQLHNEFGEI